MLSRPARVLKVYQQPRHSSPAYANHPLVLTLHFHDFQGFLYATETAFCTTLMKVLHLPPPPISMSLVITFFFAFLLIFLNIQFSKRSKYRTDGITWTFNIPFKTLQEVKAKRDTQVLLFSSFKITTQV